MNKKPTYWRWLISLMLVVFTISGFSQNQEPLKNPNDKAALTRELNAVVFDSERLTPDNPTRGTTATCPTTLAEGFEGTTFPPSGWVRYNQLGTSQWSRSTSLFQTGVASAYIAYQSTGGDDWLVTPRLSVVTGDQLSFWIRHAFTSAYPPDQLTVMVSTTNNQVASFTTTLATLNVGTDYTAVFAQKSYSLNAFAGQNIYIAFRHTNTDGNGIYIDNVTGPAIYSFFNGVTAMDFGATYDLGVYSKTYEITNCGSTALNVSLNSASPELSISGLPVSVPVGGITNITVTFDPAVAGAYAGSFVLATNDPVLPTVTVNVSSTVSAVVTAPSFFQDFNAVADFALPTNWMGNFSVRANGGLLNSKRLSRNLFGTTTSKTGQFTTPFVNLALNSKLSFNYRIVEYTSYPLTPTPANELAMTVYMSLDYGVTFIPIYVYDPLTHVESLQYTFKEIDLSAYAGQTAMFVFMAEEFLSGDFYLDFDDISMISAVPGLEILNPSLSMGYRPIGAWMEPARFEIVNNPGAGALSISTADIDNNYGGFVEVVAPTLPYTLASGATTTAFGLTANVEATAVAGPFTGQYAVIYGANRALATATYDGMAYVPIPGDVVENATTMAPTPLPAPIPFPSSRESGGFYKNYILPNDLGNSADENDLVFKLEPPVDMLFNISAIMGSPVNFALYAEGFEGEGGPMATNAMVQAYDNLVDVELFAGNTYYIVISALVASNGTYTLLPMPAPDPVTYVAPLDGAININNAMSLSWTFGNNVSEYEVVLGTTYPPTTVVVPYTSNLATSYTLAGLQPNMQYFWQVNVKNTQGETEGPVWGFTTTIDVPTGLTVTLVDPAPTATTVSANLNWVGPSDRAFIGYNVYRNGVKLNTAPLTASEYQDLGLARNTTYAYRVTNVFDEGESAQSAAVTVTTKGVGIFNGFVFDYLTNDPIEGASVRISGTAGDYTVQTAANGAYSTQAYAGSYSIIVSATGYTSQSLNVIALAHAATVSNDFYLMEIPYPVADVVAIELDDNKVQVSWGGSGVAPVNDWLSHDDGVNYDAIGAGGTAMACASRWTPAMLAPYAGTQLTKVQFFPSASGVDPVYELNVWTGSTPTLVRSQPITGFIPGQWNEITLNNPVDITGNEEVWFGYTIVSYTGYPAGCDDGPAINGYGNKTYYAGVWYNLTDLNAALIYNWNLRGFVTNAGNRSVQQMVAVNNSAFEDIRPGATNLLEASGHTNTSAHASLPKTFSDNGRAVVSYDVWREKVYQPGTLELIGNTVQEDFVDFDWGIQDWGVYRWAVTVNYDAAQVSAPTYSNTLDKDMYTMVDVTVALNSADSPAGTQVTFTNTSEPTLELVYDETLGGSGVFTWDMFRKGTYDIDVFKAGFMPVSLSNVDIFDEASFEWLLIEILAPPTDLYVTPTGFATWQGGIGTPFEPFMESFDGLVAGTLPEGWTKSPETTNWAVHNGTNAGGVAPQMRFSWTPSSTNDYYLKTPVMSTIGQSTLQLSFRNMVDEYTGPNTLKIVAIADGVEYVIDQWVNEVANRPASMLVYDLTSAHGVGAAEFQIAWVMSGYTLNIDYWYIDDVSLMGAAKAPKSFQTYKVFHDGVLVAETGESMYQYGTNGEALVDGETYLAEVATVYSTGQSPRASYTWTYIACDNYATPGNFAGAQVEGTLDVNLTWTIPTIPVGEDQIDFARISRDGEVITETDAAMYLDEDLDIGTYEYCITFVYESGAETCPATICTTVDVTGGGLVNGNVSQAAYLGGDGIEGAVLTLTNVATPSISFTFTTDADGDYDGEVLAGTYNYSVVAEGYITATLAAVAIPQSSTVTRDFELMEFPAPVELVVATELSDNAVQVTWRTPGTILFEPTTVNFDAGIPSDWTVVSGGNTADTWEGVTNFGGSTLDGTPFVFVDSDGAGTAATLDEMLVSPVFNVLGTSQLFLQFDQYYRHLGTGTYGQVDVYDGTAWVTVLNQVATAGAWGAPNHQSIDVTAYANPEFQVRFHYFDNISWAWYWAVDNVTITDEAPLRSVMAPPVSTLAGYNVYRTTCVEGGDLQFLGYTLDTLFNDNTWVTAESGTYKWAVEAVYAENESEVRFSNCLDKDMITQVSVTVITNSGDSPEETDVMLTNISEPELGLVYDVELDATGYFMWEEFRKGTYDVYVEKNGFAPIMETVEIDGPTNLSYILEELLAPVSDLHVSPTGFATWRPGGIIPFEGTSFDFEADAQGWDIQGNVNGWQWGNNASLSSSFMTFNGNSTNFIAVNADAAGSAGPAIVAMAKSPMMNLENADEVYLSFDYLLNTDAISVHYSIAEGAPVLIENLALSATAWTNKVIMLPEEALAADVQIIFLFTESGTWSYGGGVDNVVVSDVAPDSRALEYYKVWLDGIFVTDTPETFYQYDPANLVPGQEYFSEVAAVYSNGISAKMDYTWTYYPCDSFPGPDDLTYEVVDVNDVVLNWGGNTPPPPPGGDFFEDFEAGTLPTGWMSYDVDNDGYKWDNSAVEFSIFDAHAGLYCMASASYRNDVGALTPNNWLVTPAIAVTATSQLKFWVDAQDPLYAGEQYYVKVSTTGNAVADFTTTIHTAVPAGDWSEVVKDLSAYAGQTIYIAFQHANVTDMFFLKLDDVTVTNTATRAAQTSPLAAAVSHAVSFKTQGMSQSEIDARIQTSRVLSVVETATTSGNTAIINGTGKSLSENRAVLFNNGPLVNSAGTAVGGADESILQSALGMTSYGSNVNNGAGYSMADDFVVDANWAVESFEFFAYQTGSTTTSTLTGAYFQIYNGAPNAGGTVVYGDLTTNRMSSTSWSNIYRNNDGPGGSTNRPVMKAVCNVTDLTLEPGTYWVEYTLTGSLASGPWTAPITINGQTTTGNALQWNGTAWAPLQDGGTFTNQGVPIIINGTVEGGGGGGSTTFDPGEFLGANVYRDGELIAEMVQGETYTDMDVEPGYYDYCVTFVYAENAMSCLSTCVLDVLVTEDCEVPQNLTATGVEDNNEVTLVWNENVAAEFRYDDGVSLGQLGSSTGTINTVLGAKHTSSAELTEMSWYTTAEGGPHTTVQIYVFGLTSAGLPNGNDVLYTASVTNTDATWNTHTFPTPITADGGFLIGIGYNGFAAIGTDDGVGAPYVFQNNTHYFVGDYTAGGWETWETYAFNVNAMIRAIGVEGAKASYAVAPAVAPVTGTKDRMSMVYTTNEPVATGAPQWSTPARDRNRAFLGYNIYREGSLLEALWPETTYVYLEGNAGQTCYTVTAEYEFCGETEPSNEACVDFITGVNPTDLSEIKVYPNPSNSTVNIELTNNVSQVVIYNYLGQVVMERNITDETILNVNVRNYEAGAYLVKFVTSEGKSLTKKVVVTK